MWQLLFGEDREPQPPRWLEQFSNSFESPIIRLVDAICQQAVTDKATRFRFVVDPNRVNIDLPTEEEWGKRIALEEWLAEDKVPRADDQAREPELWVDFEYDEEYRVAMVIPGNIARPTIGRLRVRFNFQRFASSEEPENLIYVDDCFLSLEHYSLTDCVRAVVRIEPESH